MTFLFLILCGENVQSETTSSLPEDQFQFLNGSIGLDSSEELEFKKARKYRLQDRKDKFEITSPKLMQLKDFLLLKKQQVHRQTQRSIVNGNTAGILSLVSDISNLGTNPFLEMHPSVGPSKSPSSAPSLYPSKQPSIVPSLKPSSYPTKNPSLEPSVVPTLNPSTKPSLNPSNQPSEQPSLKPSVTPTLSPTLYPTSNPSLNPSQHPSLSPSLVPSHSPSIFPSQFPSKVPSIIPTSTPSVMPSSTPSMKPSSEPSLLSSVFPSLKPSLRPSLKPSVYPSLTPSLSPSTLPTIIPSAKPSVGKSGVPTLIPSLTPSLKPNIQPSVSPSYSPVQAPSITPSNIPSSSPSNLSSLEPSKESSSSPTIYPSSSPSISSISVSERLFITVENISSHDLSKDLIDIFERRAFATLDQYYRSSYDYTNTKVLEVKVISQQNLNDENGRKLLRHLEEENNAHSNTILLATSIELNTREIYDHLMTQIVLEALNKKQFVNSLKLVADEFKSISLEITENSAPVDFKIDEINGKSKVIDPKEFNKSIPIGLMAAAAVVIGGTMLALIYTKIRKKEASEEETPQAQDHKFIVVERPKPDEYNIVISESRRCDVSVLSFPVIYDDAVEVVSTVGSMKR